MSTRCDWCSRNADVSVPALFTDEGKLSQILRNFISNALKFTERGEVRVSAEPAPAPRPCVSWSRTPASASPRGISERIFEEFTQVDHPHAKAE